MSLPIIAIVIPCYNENEVLYETTKRLDALLNDYKARQLISVDSYVLYVDDGSKDNTWQIISEIHQSNPSFKGLKLSRNHGHQNALLAGLSYATESDATISVDADLQDDLNVMEEMILHFRNGKQIVYGVRNERKTDTFFKRNTALLFYKFIEKMGVESVYNHADYRLIGHKALKTFLNFPEKNLYLRGMIPLVGYPSEKVYYDRSERFAGESKYNLKKMFSLAWNGITSLSIKPLRFVTACGFIIFFISIILSIYALYSYINDKTIAGWTSIVLPVYFLGGIQLLCIGLLGEYVAKIYKEVKNRPRFIVEDYLN